MIHATCHTADNVRCIEFDATPWFSEADAPSIIDLASTALQIPSSADEDTNACTTSLSMRRSGFSRNPSRTQAGKRSNVSSTGRRLWPGSRKTGLTLWRESRARADISAEESCFHKGVEKLIGDEPTAA